MTRVLETLTAPSMQFGANLRPNGGVDFCLWAPAASSVQVELGESLIDAEAIGEGWWKADGAHAAEGSSYRFIVDGLAVPDPASRFNPGGPHGASEVMNLSSYEWATSEWLGRPWHEVVLYELHVGTFTKAGTYAAAQKLLPQLAAMGVTAIQLMPLADFPGEFGWGYDGVLHFAPHAAYGHPGDLKRFIDCAHSHELMVFMDVVYNHFGPDANYLNAYAPQFFSSTHEGPWGRSINFDGDGSRTVRDFYISNVLYWLREFRIDGLRFDAVHAIVDDSNVHIIEEISQRVRAEFKDRLIHLVTEDDHNTAGRISSKKRPGKIDGQWAGDFHHLMHVLLTGESSGYYAEYTHEPMKQLLRTLTRGVAWRGDPSGEKSARVESRDDMPLNGVVNFLQNHDQTGNRAYGERLPRLVELAHPEAGDAPIRLATALLILAPHTPLLFMGQEWNASTPFLYFANWSGELRDAVTEGRKREFAHFQGTANRPVPDPCEPDTFTASKLDRDESYSSRAMRWKAFFEELLTLRRIHLWPSLPQLRIGGHNGELVGKRGIVVRWRFEDGRVLQAALNFSDVELKLAGNTPDGVLMFSIGNETDKSQSNVLGPWSGQWRWITAGV